MGFKTKYDKIQIKKKNMSKNCAYQDIANELNLGLLINTDVIQSLWGGYGELVRLVFENKSVIVKHIKLPKPEHHPKEPHWILVHFAVIEVVA